MPLDVYEISVIYKQSIQKKGFLNCMEIYIYIFSVNFVRGLLTKVLLI